MNPAARKLHPDDQASIARHRSLIEALGRVTGTTPPPPARPRLRRPWWAVAATVALVALGLGGIADAAQEEPIQNRARGVYVDAMRGIADAYEYATQVALSRGEIIACPVPGSEFVASFGAPRDGHTHQGTDMMAGDGTPIYAPEPGMYRTHGNDSFYLDGVSGGQWFGTHLQGHARGDGPVAAGELIAYVGHSGNASASAPHLHLEYHPDGGAAVEHYPTLAAACFGSMDCGDGHDPCPPTARESRVASPTFVYGVMEIHRWANGRYGRITPVEARRLTAFLNQAVGARLAGYIDAISARDLIARWAGVADCESGGDPTTNTGNGYYGAYQFSLPTWQSVGGTGYPHQASLAEQTRRAELLRLRSGLGQWPVCGSRYGG